MTKTTDRTKTTPEIAQEIRVQAAQAGMSITSYMKMIVDNAKEIPLATQESIKTDQNLEINHMNGGTFIVPMQFIEYFDCYVDRDGIGFFECTLNEAYLKILIARAEAIRIIEIMDKIYHDKKD